MIDTIELCFDISLFVLDFIQGYRSARHQKLLCQLSRTVSNYFDEFSILLKLVDVMNLFLNLSLPFNI